MRHCDVRCPVLTHSVSVQNCQQAEVSGEHQLLQQHGGALDLHHLLSYLYHSYIQLASKCVWGQALH